MSRNENGSEIALGCLLIIMMIPVGILVRGFVLMRLWGWFVVPFGIMEIGVAHALGLSTCIALFHNVSSSDKELDGEQPMGNIVANAVVKMIVAPLFVLLLGFIFHCFM